MIDNLEYLTQKEEVLKQELKKIRNSNLAPEERPMALDEIHCELSLLKKKRQKVEEKISNDKAIEKVIGTAVIVISVNGDEDKRMEIIVVDENKEEITTINNIYIVSKVCPLFRAIEKAKKNDLIVIEKEHKGKKITTIIKVEEKNF